MNWKLTDKYCILIFTVKKPVEIYVKKLSTRMNLVKDSILKCLGFFLVFVCF